MTTKQVIDLLLGTPLFSKCDRTRLASIVEGYAQIVPLAQGEALCESFSKKLGVLLDGTADIYSADQGKSLLLRTLSKTDAFGVAGLFAKGEQPLSRIEASTQCQLLLFSAEAIRSLLAQDPGFLDAYLSFLAGRVQFLNRKIRCFTAGSAERRLALWLAAEESEHISLPSSLTALSDMLDIARASLYRALDKLEQEGLITRTGREITIPSREAILQKYQSP